MDAENTPQPAQVAQSQNEPAPSENAQPQTGLFDRLKSIATAATERTVEVVKRGRGRPRSDGQPKASDVVREAPGTAQGAAVASPGVAVPSPAVPILRPGVLKRAVTGFVKGLTVFPTLIIDRLAAKKGYSPDEVHHLAQKLGPTDDECESLAEIAEYYSAKAEINPEHMPLVILCLTLGGMVTRFAACVFDLRRMPNKKP